MSLCIQVSIRTMSRELFSPIANMLPCSPKLLDVDDQWNGHDGGMHDSHVPTASQARVAQKLLVLHPLYTVFDTIWRQVSPPARAQNKHYLSCLVLSVFGYFLFYLVG